MIWSLVLASLGLLTIYMAGKRSRWGWAIGLGTQVLWVAYAVATHQHGFILSAAVYGALYAKNLWEWSKK